MVEHNQNSSVESAADIHIVGLNREKTRKANASESEYQIYFELSGSPPQVWKILFEQEWTLLVPQLQSGKTRAEASMDGRFLVLHCTLQETAGYLPLLKQAVAATNKKFDQYAKEQATEQGQREDVWKQERKAVDDLADSLHFT